MTLARVLANWRLAVVCTVLSRAAILASSNPPRAAFVSDALRVFFIAGTPITNLGRSQASVNAETQFFFDGIARVTEAG
jgi:hypothetical protein